MFMYIQVMYIHVMYIHDVNAQHHYHQPHASRLDRSKPMAAVHARSCPANGLKLVQLVQLCGSFEVNRNAFSYHTIAALLVFFFSFFWNIFHVLLSVHDYTWLLSGGTLLQCGNKAELRWYRSCPIFWSFWCWNLLWMPHSKDLYASDLA